MSPEGAIWDAPLSEAPLAFLDLEMTGLDPASDSIVQVCVERTVGSAVRDRFLSFVRPAARDGAHHIHGISAEELAGAPAFEEIASDIEAIVSDAVVVAHRADHDLAFLGAALTRAGRPWERRCYLDTLRLSRRAIVAPSHRLAALASQFGIAESAQHRADSDVLVLRGLFAQLVEMLRPASARELWQLQEARRIVRPQVLEAAERARDAGLPVRVRYRRAARGIQEFGFCVRAVRADLDPPLVLGYLLPTRGRRELRADRIVTIEMLGNDCA